MGWHPKGIPGALFSDDLYRDDIGYPVPGSTGLSNAELAENDNAMVCKVAADPYGIGYCSAIYVDFDRVQVLGLKDPVTRREYYFPNADPAHRWEVGDDAPTPEQWPMVRTIYAVCGGRADQDGQYTTFADFFLKPGSKGRQCLLQGPLFTASYWRLGVNDK
jgi:ABC-type phosphate transport system substrate-binding protein